MMFNQTSRTATAKRRTGAILPLAVILLVLLIGMVAFAVDLGYLSLARTQIQAAADAGALAGAIALGKDAPGDVRLLAQTAVQANKVAGSAGVIELEDVELGTWNSDTHQFTRLSGADESEANSVRVTCHRSFSRGNPIQLFFAPVLGVDFGEASASAVALRAPICGAFIGLQSVDLKGNGSYTDSYNSSLGEYTSQAPGKKGHICSNGSINVQNGTVNGNAIPGSGEEVSIGPQGDVSGSTTPRKERLSVPAVDFGDVVENNDNDKLPNTAYSPTKQEFKHNGGEINLPAGTFYFTDLNITGGPVIINEPVKIYVDGDFSVSGSGIVTSTQSPKNLQVFVTGKAVKIAGNSSFSGVVYAPSSHIDVAGGAEFFGAAVGKSIKFHNHGGVHADESVLGSIPARSRLVD